VVEYDDREKRTALVARSADGQVRPLLRRVFSGDYGEFWEFNTGAKLAWVVEDKGE